MTEENFQPHYVERFRKLLFGWTRLAIMAHCKREHFERHKFQFRLQSFRFAVSRA